MRLGVEAAIVDGRARSAATSRSRTDGSSSVGLAPKRGGGIAVPGFVDLQVNGFGGVDFAAADAAGYSRAGEALLEGGVTAYQPTLITAPEEDSDRRVARGARASRSGPRILGVHLEGPFLSPNRLGAHPAAARRDPDRGAARAAARRRPGSATSRSRRSSPARSSSSTCCTSAASSSRADTPTRPRPRPHAAFDRGVGTVTHLFNAMRPLGHRDPGIAGAALARDDVVVQVILDGHHLADGDRRVVWRAAAGRVALVTDAIAAAGVGDGELPRSASVDVEVRGRRRAARRRRPRRQRRDDDRRRAEPARARRVARGRGRGGDLDPRTHRAPARPRRARPGRRRRTSWCSTTGSRSARCSVAGGSGWRPRWPRSCIERGDEGLRRRRRRPSTTSRSGSRTASSWCSSARPAAASRRCCG